MRFFFETVILIIFAILALFLYQNYWDDLAYALFGEEQLQTIYIGSTAIDVSVADDLHERVQGLSGVPGLRDFQGKLFIFDTDDQHGIWMKDMLFPIDIIWIDRNLKVIHIEENVHPNTYPSKSFAPPTDARFVLEMNAFFVSSIKVSIGDRLTLPPSLIPKDIKKDLRE